MRWHYVGLQRLMSTGDEERMAPGGTKATKRVRTRNVTVQRNPEKNVAIKYLSLVILILQNASQVLLIRYTRRRVVKDELFLSTVAVFFTECVKLVTCLILVAIQERGPRRYVRALYGQIIMQPIDTLKVCVPSILYTIQNNLLYIAVSNLEAATFMVTYQLKILTTALCSVIMLRKPLSYMQWTSLLILFVGVCIVQWQESLQKDKSIVVSTTAMPTTWTAGMINGTTMGGLNTTEIFETSPVAPTAGSQHEVQNKLLGFGAVVISCLISGFAGVYFEKILKGSEVTVWMRNIQLALIAIPTSLIMLLVKDNDVIQAKGMLHGIDWVVWTVIGLYAVGGLTVAVVMKYADNILKGFATSLSIIVSCVFSVYFFGFRPTIWFCVGTVLVMLAVYIYSKYPYKVRYVPSTEVAELEEKEMIKDGKPVG